MTINIVLIYLVIISLYLDELESGIIGAVLGIILDSSVGGLFGSNGLSFLLSKTIYNVCQLTSIIKIVVVPIINSLIGILVYKIFKKPILSLEEE